MAGAAVGAAGDAADQKAATMMRTDQGRRLSSGRGCLVSLQGLSELLPGSDGAR